MLTDDERQTLEQMGTASEDGAASAASRSHAGMCRGDLTNRALATVDAPPRQLGWLGPPAGSRAGDPSSDRPARFADRES
jgi:hypothetical protein